VWGGEETLLIFSLISGPYPYLVVHYTQNKETVIKRHYK
jgi:hypothetical protein